MPRPMVIWNVSYSTPAEMSGNTIGFVALYAAVPTAAALDVCMKVARINAFANAQTEIIALSETACRAAQHLRTRMLAAQNVIDAIRASKGIHCLCVHSGSVPT